MCWQLHKCGPNPMRMLQVSTDIVACLTAFNEPSWGLVPNCLKLKPVCRDTESPSREGPEQSCATPRHAVICPAGAHKKYTSGIISLQITEGGENLLAASFLSLPLHKGDVLCEDGVDDSLLTQVLHESTTSGGLGPLHTSFT